jgi:hypothetical protein
MLSRIDSHRHFCAGGVGSLALRLFGGSGDIVCTIYTLHKTAVELVCDPRLFGIANVANPLSGLELSKGVRWGELLSVAQKTTQGSIYTHRQIHPSHCVCS